MVLTLDEVKSTIATAVKTEVDAKSVDMDAKIEAKVNEIVDAKLEEIKIAMPNINTAGKEEKELKLFDPCSGELVAIRKVDDKYAAANRMLKCILAGDQATALKISDEIHADNDRIQAKKFEMLGIKTPTPTVSDSVTRGGYAIPTEVNAEIMQMIYKQSVMYANANKNAIQFESKLYPVMYGVTFADIADQSTAVTESNPTFSNPTVTMQRAGAFSAISNKIIREKGADLLNAFKVAYSSGAARFLDLRLAVGNVTGSSDLVDGILFDANMVLETPIALSALDITDLESMLSSISADVDLNTLKWTGNRKVMQKIGGLKDTAGNPLFPNYYSGGDFSPLGVQKVTNPYIPSTLDVGGDARATGTDDVLMLIDYSKFIVGLADNIMIDMSKDIYFLYDAVAIRGIQDYGCKLLMSTTVTTGGVARALELTN